MASQTSLSLVAEFDDLMRCTNVLMESSLEPEFIRFAVNMEECRRKWLAAVEDCRRLQGELEKSNKDNSELEAKLLHVRRIFDNEKKRRVEAETQVAALEKKLSLVRELVFVDGGAKINDETKEKLNFLNTMTNSMAGHDDFGRHTSRLTTISEAMNSTGSLLADLSVSQSEDDVDAREIFNEKEWRKHRPSFSREGEATSAKRRRSDVKEKTVDLDATDGVVATATFTMMKDGPVEMTTKVQPITASQTTCKPPKPSAPPLDSETEDSVWGTARMNLITPKSTPHEVRHTQVSPSVAGLYPFGMNNKVNNRLHSFCNKVVIYPEDCGVCGKRIKFGKCQLKCRDCRATCHPECREKVPLPCVPIGNTPTRRGGAMNTIADFAPPTAPMVPAIIVHCVKEVESRGLNEVGIYRIPGSERDVKTLKEKFLRGKGVPNLSRVDIHVICGTLKDFLRSLSQPLVPQSQWQDFTKAAEDTDEVVGRALMIQAISELPQPNRDTLAYLIMHLQRVAECPECKMPASNLAKVFGPTVVGYSSLNPEPQSMLTETRKQVAVMEQLMSVSSDYWANFVNVDAGLISSTPSEIYLTPSTECLIPISGNSRHFFTPNSRVTSRKGNRLFPKPVPSPNV